MIVPGLSWQTLFWLGGISPLVVALACQLFLPPFPVRRAGEPRQAIGIGHALGGEGRAMPTALLWITTLCVSISVSMMVNWLPSLMRARLCEEASTGRIVMMLTLGGAASGFAAGLLARRLPPWLVYGMVWLGMIGSVVLMVAAGQSELAAAIASFGLGFFLSGGQFLLYGLATDLYPHGVRGTGTGFAVGVGRFGAVVGPLLAAEVGIRHGLAVYHRLQGRWPVQGQARGATPAPWFRRVARHGSAARAGVRRARWDPRAGSARA